MSLDLRAAGALVLIYGLTLSRIAYLTRDNITHSDGQAWLRHHGHQLLLPPRLAAFIRQLASQPAPATTLTRLAGPPRWLFPGNDPTRPASHAHLCTGLSRHGITIHAARNTAIGTLAAELPAYPRKHHRPEHQHRDQLDTQHQPRLDRLLGCLDPQKETAGDEGLLQYASFATITRQHPILKREMAETAIICPAAVGRP